MGSIFFVFANKRYRNISLKYETSEIEDHGPEAVDRRYSVKRVILKVSQNSQGTPVPKPYF